ncbi:AAA family ATPase [Actinocorallia sp. API 0066]|uniref:AAA family ATPase n=1 Tax=Actinocorallia sp. API 0066 TaxID=2896846 RepID=UPI001E331AB6|nr:AAA family ATPase [Actinocorallia sp. API 0066]MCD0451475.1 AAA family ATPase [Actinocorallia sp. API 0066]
MADPVIAAFDGPPGAGKTSLIARLATAHGDAAVWFAEPNHLLATPRTDDGVSRWFLDHEAAKARSIRALADDPATGLIMADRNHLGALAYCYAHDGGTVPRGTLPFTEALAYYMRHVLRQQPERLRTVVLLVSPSVSLARRGGTPERALWRQWYDPALLDRLHAFYRDIAPGLCPNRPLVIDTDALTLDQVHAHVAAHLAAAGLPDPRAWPPLPARPLLGGVFTDAYARLGGLETLGHPVTGPLAWRGGLVQICQLATLHRGPDGPAGLWRPDAPLETLR